MISSFPIPDSLLVLHTSRLLLRPLTIADAPAIFNYAQNPEVTQFTGWETHRTVADSEFYIEQIVLPNYASGKAFDWGIVLKANNQLVGVCGLVHIHPIHQRAELGYSLGRTYWGQGLATEAAQAVISFGFHSLFLNRIEGKCHREHHRSARVLTKLGMEFEGMLRQYMFVKGEFWDMAAYALLKPHYGPTHLLPADWLISS